MAHQQLTVEEARQRLEAGNARFAAGTSEHPHADAARRRETSEGGQHPFATVITCSDSRVPPEILFDAGIGDLFVIRVAGNVCNTDEAASIEYGVDHLETPICVVLGHSQCGAVTAVVSGAKLHGNIPKLVAPIGKALARAKAAHPGCQGDALIDAAIEENVWQAIADLLASSAAARRRVRAGTLHVLGALYDLASGGFQWLGPHPDQERLAAD